MINPQKQTAEDYRQTFQEILTQLTKVAYAAQEGRAISVDAQKLFVLTDHVVQAINSNKLSNDEEQQFAEEVKYLLDSCKIGEKL